MLVDVEKPWEQQEGKNIRTYLETCYTSRTFLWPWEGFVHVHMEWSCPIPLESRVCYSWSRWIFFKYIYKYIMYSCCYVKHCDVDVLAVYSEECSLAIFATESSSITSAFFYILKISYCYKLCCPFFIPHVLCLVFNFLHFFPHIWISAINYLVWCRLKIRI